MSDELVPSENSQSQIEQTNGNSGITNDSELISLWARRRSLNSQKKDLPRLKRFLQFVKKPLVEITTEDIYDFKADLEKTNLQLGSIKNFITVIKSVLKFGHTIKYLPNNAAEEIKIPKLKDDLAERIVSPEKILQMIALETNTRNRLILKLLYATGIRASELCGLKWKDVQKRSDGRTQIVVLGKGCRTRSVVLPEAIAKELLKFRQDAHQDLPVFPSKKTKYGGHLHVSTLEKIVKAARLRAGIEEEISPHWFRHSHATHSIEQGAPIHLVRNTLGHSSIKITARYLHVRPGDSSSRFLTDY